MSTLRASCRACGTLAPRLAETVERLIPRFETVYYLKPLSNKGRSAWLYRVYPGPWQVIEQRRDDTALLAALDQRPTFAEVFAIMQGAPAPKAKQQQE